MDNYLTKENYITVNPDPIIWLDHANVKIIKKYKKHIKGIVCDLGANHCSTTVHLLKNTTITKIYALDINEGALKVAFDTINKMNPSIPFNLLVCNLMNIPLENDTFDFIQSFHTLEHIYPEDINKVISEAYRLLKSGGHILISIPYDHAYPDEAHVAFYNVDSLCKLFEDNGFITIECMKDNRWNEKDLLTGLFTLVK